MGAIVFDSTVTALLRVLEEAARADSSGSRFIEPSEGILEDTKAKRHHLIFGRRGSGKSSLLAKLRKDLANSGTLVVEMDVESLNQNAYPDILVHLLILLFRQLTENLSRQAGLRLSLTRFRRLRKLRRNARIMLRELDILLHSVDDSELTIRLRNLRKISRRHGGSVDLQGLGSIQGGGETSSESEHEQGERFRRNKISILNKNIERYRALIREFHEVSGLEMYCLVDDLYHIARVDQAPCIGYLHKLAKNNHLWLKVGTIRFKTEWYRYEATPVGMKINDDASETNLDLSLESYATTKAFLGQIASSLLEECGDLHLLDLITDNAIDRLVLACGGVARDFINLLRSAILKARERLTGNPHHPRGERVGVEDVNQAAGDYGDSKMEEFAADSGETESSLRAKFETIRQFCLETSNANVFLLPQNHGDLQVEELVDLRLLHRISPRVTVSKRKGAIYKAYMLDLSQYTGARKVRDFDIIEPSQQDSLRRVGLILT